MLAFVIERIAKFLAEGKVGGADPMDLEGFTLFRPFYTSCLPPRSSRGGDFDDTTHKLLLLFLTTD